MTPLFGMLLHNMPSGCRDLQCLQDRGRGLQTVDDGVHDTGQSPEPINSK